ncbi:MAG TPA: hypothetical protein VLS88_01560 [Polyangiales bacterium]|nr:hypothetical protein [Polyangiales bacterium]
MRAVLRWLLWVALSIFLLLVLSGALLVWTSPGRGVLAGWVEDLASSQIPGSMKIGKLESIGFIHPVATDVEFFTPGGERVIRVDKAEAQWNLKDLFKGKIGFDTARAEGGEILIEIKEGGRTNMEDAFKSPSPEGEEKGQLDLNNMHFQGMTVLLRLSGETRFVVRDVQGFLSVWRRDTPGVRVNLGLVRGTFEKPEITGDKIELIDMHGEVWAQERHVVSMEFKTRIGGGGIDASFDYYKREENPAELILRPETGSGARLAAMVIQVRSLFSDKLHVTITN